MRCQSALGQISPGESSSTSSSNVFRWARWQSSTALAPSTNPWPLGASSVAPTDSRRMRRCRGGGVSCVQCEELGRAALCRTQRCVALPRCLWRGRRSMPSPKLLRLHIARWGRLIVGSALQRGCGHRWIRVPHCTKKVSQELFLDMNSAIPPKLVIPSKSTFSDPPSVTSSFYLHSR